MTAAHLSKLHATGNDFLVWSWLGPEGSDFSIEESISPEQARALCDRHTGIGADGLIIVRPATATTGAASADATGEAGADVEMVLFNADGGLAEMSGNGIRALAWVAVRDGYGRDGRLVVDTAGGRRVLDLVIDPTSGELTAATVDMGPVTFVPAEIPVALDDAAGIVAELDDVKYEGDAAGMGNPHLVLFVDDPAAARVTEHGPRLEHDPKFPARTNVHFVRPTPGANDELDMRVWERGVGETLSCGTGASASAAVAHRRGLVGERVTVHVPGGDLTVEIDATPGGTIRLGGPVVHVFDTTIELPVDLPVALSGERA
jgi:diaminopimelate epimerase